MKQFIALAASLFLAMFALATPAQASVGHPFLKGVKNPHQLASLMRVALTRDSTGMSPIRADCTPQTGCASVHDYLVEFQEDDKTFTVDIAHLPDYVEKLVLRDGPSGNHWMACITGEGTSHTDVWNCLSRPFKTYPDGRLEKAWVDPATGKPKLAEDCSNPIGQPDVPVEVVASPCNDLYFEMMPGDTIHIGKLGKPLADPHHCLAVKRAGEDEWETTLTNPCPIDCNFAGPAKALHLAVQSAPRISFVAAQAGMNVLRVPQGYDGVIELCLVKPNGARSCGKPVANKEYYLHEHYIALRKENGRWSNRTWVWDFSLADCPPVN